MIGYWQTLIFVFSWFLFSPGNLYAFKKRHYIEWLRKFEYNFLWSLVIIFFYQEEVSTIRLCLKLFSIFLTCNNFCFGKIINSFKLRVLVIVLFMEINGHRRPKERQHSHDTKSIYNLFLEKRIYTARSSWYGRIIKLIFKYL